MEIKINKFIKAIVLFTVSSIAVIFSPLVLSETIYVSDELKVPMRSGTNSSYRIVSFLLSGTPLNVLERNDDGNWVRVSTPQGKEGWIESVNVMKQKSARDRIVDIDNQLDRSKDKANDLKKALAEVKAENKKLTKELEGSQKRVAMLESDMAYLKKVSASPITLANKNRVLQENIDTVTRQNEQLKDKVERLSDDSTKDWFILGASVSIGSLILGLLLTKIRWQKKRSWGDF